MQYVTQRTRRISSARRVAIELVNVSSGGFNGNPRGKGIFQENPKNSSRIGVFTRLNKMTNFTIRSVRNRIEKSTFN